MTSKERVSRALRREPVDRIPVYMWFHPGTARALAASLEVPEGAVEEVMGNDVRQTWVNNNFAMEGIVHERDGESHVDDWGIEWVRSYGFNQIRSYPLAQASREEVLACRFPVDRVESLLAPMARLAGRRDDCFLGVDVSPCGFEMYWRLRGMEGVLVDLAADPDLADAMIGRCADFAIRLGREAIERFRPDWLWTGDDVASQSGLIFSPGTWRERVKPHLARVFALGRAAGLPVAYHCCGALRPIIPDLIETGMDVLNPVQAGCPGMDPLELKREFGASLAFMGGVDTQELLPRGSERQVREATRRLIDGMTAGGGGYILAASHTVPPETPLANIFAMYGEAGLPREAILDRAADWRAAQQRRAGSK